MSKQDIIQQIELFKANAEGNYFLPIPTIICSMPTIEEAYLQIGRNASDCKYYYDGLAYREDLYDLFLSLGLPHDDAFSIMQKVRKGLAEKVCFENYSIPQKLSDWCLGVRYLPSREIVTSALTERVNKIADNEKEFRAALLDTLPEYKYTPMTFIGSNDVILDISRRVYELGNLKGFRVEEEAEFQIRDYDIDYRLVKIITITGHKQASIPQQDVIYACMCDLISSGIPIVALIDKDSMVILEERIRALLHRGVVCEI